MLTLALYTSSFAPIMAMQNAKENASVKLILQNNSVKLAALNAFNPRSNRMIMLHIAPNHKNAAEAFLEEKQREGADLWTLAGIFAARVKGKYDQSGTVISADVIIRKFEAAESGISNTETSSLRDIHPTDSTVIATVEESGLISLALAPTKP